MRIRSLLIEEFAGVGVETLFVRSPRATTPEDQLLLQFQGMIAEYERAQILERSRRGKRHRAQQGQVNVLSGAPFGYRYVRKTDQSAAYYEVVENQARIVRMVYELYTVQGLSIGAITRHLNGQRISLAKGSAAGSDRHCGPCCAIPLTRVSPVSARRRSRRASALPGPFGFAEASRLATALAMSAHAPTGLPFPYRRSSARTLSRSPPNGWRPTKTIPPAAR